jgi:hypothetical protein
MQMVSGVRALKASEACQAKFRGKRARRIDGRIDLFARTLVLTARRGRCQLGKARAASRRTSVMLRRKRRQLLLSRSHFFEQA